MRSLVLAFALLPAAALAEDRAPAPEAAPVRPLGANGCQNAAMRHADVAVPVTPRSLEQEPQADRYLPVLRYRDGCDIPVKVRAEDGERQR